MENQRGQELMAILENIRSAADENLVTKLELDKCVRVIHRLDSFSAECEQCYQYVDELSDHLTLLNERIDQLTEEDIKIHKQKVNKITSHLMKRHQLVTKGYYTGVYMSIGIALGVSFGAVYDNLAIGIPIGVAMGVAIGASMEASAKQKDRLL
ncbi:MULTISPECIES: hypothetical protein [Gracilibacillus]|uniref:hypothetical protein n=1 Tax=Gracilibacillus TaxID=74385 RepID=UPI000824F71B|nr:MULTISPECIES: hypothetical protein [Gracilibacillus]